jgi:hypothetical protein
MNNIDVIIDMNTFRRGENIYVGEIKNCVLKENKLTITPELSGPFTFFSPANYQRYDLANFGRLYLNSNIADKYEYLRHGQSFYHKYLKPTV